jgi:hypothetical protein
VLLIARLYAAPGPLSRKKAKLLAAPPAPSHATLVRLDHPAVRDLALERERQQHADALGDWPFEIGL